MKFTGKTSNIFGPVPSRRLGLSLGVDLVPYKTCSYDCIYCQLGRTTRKTIERREWVPIEPIIDELKRRLYPRPDWITLGGSGEPTLHSRIDELIDAIQVMTGTPVAVLTNGSLLWRGDVRAALANADLVIPSLDTGDPSKFAVINRPHPELTLERVLEGLLDFRREFTGRYWLEVFLLAGYTALQTDAMKIAEWAERIRPDRVQLNTVMRPPAETFAYAASTEQLAELAELFNPTAEVVSALPRRHAPPAFVAAAQRLEELIRRRPCTVEDIARGLGIAHNEVVKLIERLSAEGWLERCVSNAGVYYRATRPEATEALSSAQCLP